MEGDQWMLAESRWCCFIAVSRIWSTILCVTYSDTPGSSVFSLPWTSTFRTISTQCVAVFSTFSCLGEAFSLGFALIGSSVMESLCCLVPQPNELTKPVALVKLSRKGNSINMLMLSCVGRWQNGPMMLCSINSEPGLFRELSCMWRSALRREDGSIDSMSLHTIFA